MANDIANGWDNAQNLAEMDFYDASNQTRRRVKRCCGDDWLVGIACELAETLPALPSFGNMS